MYIRYVSIIYICIYMYILHDLFREEVSFSRLKSYCLSPPRWGWEMLTNCWSQELGMPRAGSERSKTMYVAGSLCESLWRFSLKKFESLIFGYFGWWVAIYFKIRILLMRCFFLFLFQSYLLGPSFCDLDEDDEEQSYLNGDIHEEKVDHIIWTAQATGKVTQWPYTGDLHQHRHEPWFIDWMCLQLLGSFQRSPA